MDEKSNEKLKKLKDKIKDPKITESVNEKLKYVNKKPICK